MSSTRATFVLRRCFSCARILGLQRWAWKGRWLVTTHGLCHGCARALEASAAGGRQAATGSGGNA